MSSKYRKIEFGFGDIESAVNELSEYKKNKDFVFGSFNGVDLYSDVDDIDSAYTKIVGKTKAEFDEDQRKEHEKYKASELKHTESVPELTVEWIEKGNAILNEKYHELWAKCVPIRLNDLYRGFELKACLDIITKLNNGESLDAARLVIEDQGHSGMSFGLVCSMVKSFCDRGDEFVQFVK